MTYAIDPAMSFAKLFLSMKNISTRQKPLEKNLYLSCIFSQADTKSRLIRPSAYESCQVPCHPAYFYIICASRPFTENTSSNKNDSPNISIFSSECSTSFA